MVEIQELLAEMLAEKQGLGGELFDSGLRNLRKGPRQHHPDLSKTHLPNFCFPQSFITTIRVIASQAQRVEQLWHLPSWDRTYCAPPPLDPKASQSIKQVDTN